MSANLSNYLINLRSFKIKNIAYRTVKYVESPIRENYIKPKGTTHEIPFGLMTNDKDLLFPGYITGYSLYLT